MENWDAFASKLQKTIDQWEGDHAEGVDLSQGPDIGMAAPLRLRKDEATPPAPTETERHDQPPEPHEATTAEPAQAAMAMSPPIATPSTPTIPLAPHPMAPGSTPSGEPDWADLQARLQSAQGRAGIMRAGQQALHAAAPGFTPNMQAGEEDIAAAKAPLEVAQAKQHFTAEQSKLNTENAARDPNSPQSMRARESIKAFFGNTGLLPKDFDSYSAEDVAKYSSTLVPLAKDQSEERKAGAKEKAAAEGKAASLADRKKTMLSLYPEHAQEINALNDLGDAQTLQTALEGRAGRQQSATNSATEAAVASQRSLENQKKLKEWEIANKAPTAEQLTQLEGINKSAGALDVFEKGLAPTESIAGKLAANNPKIAGAIGASGADFDSLRKGTAVALARGLEGGTARPGNVEIIDSMLPEASDAPEVKARKMANVRAFVQNNHDAFLKTAQTGGTHLQPETPAIPQTITVKDATTGKTRVLPADKAQKYLQGDPKRFQAVTGG